MNINDDVNAMNTLKTGKEGAPIVWHILVEHMGYGVNVGEFLNVI